MMIPDHYATLGVDPEADPAEVRAAYLKLMRRFHPDRNASPGAAAQSYAITAAYAVLGSRDRRAKYDRDRRSREAAQRTVVTAQPASRRAPRWLAPALSIALVVLLVPLLFQPTFVSAPPDQLSSVGGVQTAAPQERARTASGVDPHVLCTLPGVSDIIKNAVFSRAAQLRREDSAADVGKLAALSVLRFDLPALNANAADGVVNCDAVVTLDVAPRVEAESGLESVSGRIGYTLNPVTNGTGGTVRLTAVDSIVPVLAAFVPATEPSARAVASLNALDLEVASELLRMSSVAPPTARPGPRPEPPVLQKGVAPPTARPAPRPETPVLQKPSFSCHAAQTTAARLVCNSPRLAQVDRELASLYGRAAANPSDVPLLVRADARFLALRDVCSSEYCVLSAYVGAINEIQRIQAGQQTRR